MKPKKRRQKSPFQQLSQEEKLDLVQIIKDNPDLFRGGQVNLLGTAEVSPSPWVPPYVPEGVAPDFPVPPDPQFRLEGGDIPMSKTHTIEQEEQRMAARAADTDEMMLEFTRMIPVLGEIFDLIELGTVNVLGKDLNNEDTDKELYNTFAAAGLLIPNILERPVKFLLRKGARNFSDVRRIMSQSPDAPDLKPLKELEQKAQEFEDRFRQEMPKFGDLQAPYSPYIQGARTERGAVNFLLENDPDLLMQFTPEAYDQGMFDQPMKDFADQYLTSYRGVNAPDAETAKRYMTEVRKGGNTGGQMEGPGLYMGNEGVTGGYGAWTGTVRTAPDVGRYGGADQIAREIGNLEAHGAAMINLPIEERQILSDIGARQGFKTYADRARVVRSALAPGQNVIDVVPTKDFVPGVHRSDYYGSAGTTSSREQQRGLETAIQNLIPIIEGYGQGGRIKKGKMRAVKKVRFK